MPEIVTTLLSYVTPGAVKAVLALAALIALIVCLPRGRRGATVVLWVALFGWLTLDVLGAHLFTTARIVTVAALFLFTLLLWWCRWSGWVTAVLFAGAAAVEILLYLPSLLRGMWLIGGVRGVTEAVYALLPLAVFLLAAAYGVRMALRSRPVKEPAVTPQSTLPTSPLPADVTLAEILPTAEPLPAVAVHTVPVASPTPPKTAAPLPATLRQTGIGAEILREKRRLDAGEITEEEFRSRRAALMGLRP